MRKKIKLVFHPESPGEQIFVYRTWWQRLWRPKSFATLREAIRHAERGLSRIESLKEFNENQQGDCKHHPPMIPDGHYPTKLD